MAGNVRNFPSAVSLAVELALAKGVATKTHVLNMPHTDWSTARWLADRYWIPPQALTLRREPKANVERYDGLRSRTEGGRHAS